MPIHLLSFVLLGAISGSATGTAVSVNKFSLLWDRTTNGGWNSCNGVVPCQLGVRDVLILRVRHFRLLLPLEDAARIVIIAPTGSVLAKIPAVSILISLGGVCDSFYADVVCIFVLV